MYDFCSILRFTGDMRADAEQEPFTLELFNAVGYYEVRHSIWPV